MPKKKKFIDKKKAITFNLVYRSQHDPLVADERAPQRVLVPANDKSKKKNKEEERKYGIYFDDEYDYLQHLRDARKEEVMWVEAPGNSKASEKPSVNLPSSVFASNVEEEVGLLNRAPPRSGLQLHLDPDIVATFDDDFDHTNQECGNWVEDDLVEVLNGGLVGSEKGSEDEDYENENEDVDSGSNYSSELDDEMGSLCQDFDTKSRFTDYSMTSSVISRNSQLTLLDETFETMFANYDESEIGPLDCEEIEGEIDTDSQLFKMAADEFEKERQLEQMNADATRCALFDTIEEVNEEVPHCMFDVKEKPNWDCESILSTYSNLYNHPKLITDPINRIRVNERTGIPMESGKLTKKALSRLDNSEHLHNQLSACDETNSVHTQFSYRNPNETPDEKKERKRQLKEYRRVRRMERKCNSVAFKGEKKKLEKSMAHNNLNRRGFILP